MRLFHCQVCDNVLYFENRSCAQCGSRVAYDPEANIMSALEPAEDGSWRSLHAPRTIRRICANAEYDACNWLIPLDCDEQFCLACRHNAIIPDLSVGKSLVEWREQEFAKHRLFYSLLRWELPLKTRTEDPDHGLAFRFLADPPSSTGLKVMTGHDSGLITIALAEADDAEREKRRVAMDEPYRTLLGHFRHETGHHYWDLLVRDSEWLDIFRSIFGDERLDYNISLQTHYADAPPQNWQETHVSAYAASHPWEDFAETWAHYLHIVDTLEMGTAFGLQVAPLDNRQPELSANLDFDPYKTKDFCRILDAWFPFVFAMNSVNRAMGRADLYPFVLSAHIINKLEFVHSLIRQRRPVSS
ncbi:MAG: putative zinc-binding metallopeptidase [Beijerinckiaceae bacterium]